MFYRTTLSNRSHVSPLGRAEQKRLDEQELCVQICYHRSALSGLTKKLQYVAMPAGIIRGSLIRLGLHGTVTPEVNLPQCMFLPVPGRNVF
jgi:Transport protein particle (TRAPP) component